MSGAVAGWMKNYFFQLGEIDNRWIRAENPGDGKDCYYCSEDLIGNEPKTISGHLDPNDSSRLICLAHTSCIEDHAGRGNPHCGNCRGTVKPQAPKEEPPKNLKDRFIEPLVHGLSSVAKEIAKELILTIFLTALISGSGFAVGLALGTVPLDVLLKGFVQGFAFGGLVSSVLTSAITQGAFALGQYVIKHAIYVTEFSKNNKQAKQLHTLNATSRFALGLFFASAGAYVAFKMIKAAGHFLVGKWLDASISLTEKQEAFALLRKWIPLSQAVAQGVSEKVITAAAKTASFTYGAIILGCITWGKRLFAFTKDEPIHGHRVSA